MYFVIPKNGYTCILCCLYETDYIFQKTIKRLDGRYGDCDDGAAFRERVGIEYSRQVTHEKETQQFTTIYLN